MRKLLAAAAVIAAGTAVLAWATDGFRAFTAESARRLAVLRSPPALPALALVDQDGKRFFLTDYEGELLAVQFIYVRCQSVCRSLGASFKQVLERVEAGSAPASLALLSISFDPRNDDLPALREWAAQQGADGRRWRVARTAQSEQTAMLTEAFGVVVIADPWGGFEHNAAIHLLDRRGRLVRIVDVDAIDELLAAADALQ